MREERNGEIDNAIVKQKRNRLRSKQYYGSAFDGLLDPDPNPGSKSDLRLDPYPYKIVTSIVKLKC